MIKRRRVAHVLVWMSFYDQLAWTPILAWMAAGVGAPLAVAWAATAYSVANLFGNLIFGLVADRFDRLSVAGTGLVLMAITGSAHLSITSATGLVLVRFFHGLAIAAVAPAALASLNDGLSRSQRGEAMARAGLVIAFASMAATGLTGRVVTKLGMGTGVVLLASMVGLVGVGTLLVRRWVEPQGNRAKTDGQAVRVANAPTVAVGAEAVQAIEQCGLGEGADPSASKLNPAGLGAAALVAFALMFLQNVLFYAYPLKGMELGMSPSVVGSSLAVFGIGSLIAFVPPLSRAADRWGRHRPIFMGMLLAGLGHFGLAMGDSIVAFAGSLFIYGLGFGLVFPAVTALNADAAGQGRRGLAFGLLTAAFSLGSISGPPVTQALAGFASPFAVAGTLALLSGAVTAGWYYLVVRQVQEPIHPGI